MQLRKRKEWQNLLCYTILLSKLCLIKIKSEDYKTSSRSVPAKPGQSYRRLKYTQTHTHTYTHTHTRTHTHTPTHTHPRTHTHTYTHTYTHTLERQLWDRTHQSGSHEQQGGRGSVDVRVEFCPLTEFHFNFVGLILWWSVLLVVV